MERKKKHYLRESLRSNPDFRDDLSRFLELHVESLPALKAAAAQAAEGTLAGDSLKDLAKLLSVSEPLASRLAFMQRFLAGRLSDGGDPEELVKELAEVSAVDIDPEKAQVLSEVLRPDEAALADEKERDAFTFGDSISSVEAKSIVSFDLEGHPFAGVNWTVNVLDGASESKSISVNVSSGELRAIARGLLHAADKAEADLAKIRGG